MNQDDKRRRALNINCPDFLIGWCITTKGDYMNKTNRAKSSIYSTRKALAEHRDYRAKPFCEYCGKKGEPQDHEEHKMEYDDSKVFLFKDVERERTANLNAIKKLMDDCDYYVGRRDEEIANNIYLAKRAEAAEDRYKYFEADAGFVRKELAAAEKKLAEHQAECVGNHVHLDQVVDCVKLADYEKSEARVWFLCQVRRKGRRQSRRN